MVLFYLAGVFKFKGDDPERVEAPRIDPRYIN